jgi:hypothetical protein
MEGYEQLKGYEGLYSISKDGNIFTHHYGKVMTPQINQDGYSFVSLSYSEGRKKCFIHRLIALQWIDNPNRLPQIDHIDRNKKNNIIENLRWCSQHTNRQNRCDWIGNLTPEQIEERIAKNKKYKADWYLAKKANPKDI